ncbi:cytochrome c [Phenylobacterium sp.]|uniref:c-type cytochrome n=1 Tax=Phenylobacterium sp. TaxID=1871053 RepID=UPI0035B2BBC9
MRVIPAFAACTLLAIAASAGCASASQPASDQPPAGQPAADQIAAVARGRAYAEKVCGACHALDPGKDSPYPPAPPFPTLAGRFTELTLQRRLAEISETGHTQMPQIMVHADDVADIVAYLNSQPTP